VSDATPEPWADAYDAVLALPDLRKTTFKTPAAGNSSRPFTINRAEPDGIEVRTSRGGRVTLRREAFDGAIKVIGDLGPLDPEGWVRVSDETLVAVLQSENRDRAVTSYVLPLLEAVGQVELARKRPAKVRLVQR
jgi:hypothetical protein